MTAIKLDAMGGMVPLVDNRQLPDQAAATCANVLVRSGALRPMAAPVEVQRFVGAIYPTARRLRFNDGTSYWYPLTDVNSAIIKAPITNDSFERFYILDPPGAPLRYNTKARILAGDPSYLLGLPPPVTPPSVTPSGGTATLQETRAYIYTYVDSFGQESAPSPATLGTAPIDATSWDIGGMDTIIPDATERPAVQKRIYRTLVAEGGGTSYNLIATIPLIDASYTDTLTNTEAALKPALETLTFLPPVTAMQGLTVMPGGFLVGWSDRTLHFSEVYRPWAWPAEYDLSLEFQVVGASVHQQTLVVATNGNPYAITGNTPLAMTPSKQDRFEPCISRASIVAGNEAVLFASANGLIAVNAAGIMDITDSLIGRDKWSTRFGAGIFGAARFGSYYLALNNASEGTGFFISTSDPREAVGRLIDFRNATHLFSDAVTDDVMMMARDGSDSVVQRVTPRDAVLFGVTARPFSWVSKEFFLPTPANFGAAIVNADTPPLGSSEQDLVAGVGSGLPSPTTPGANTLSADDLFARAGATSLIGLMGIGRYGAYINEAPAAGALPPGALPPGWLGWPWWPGVNNAEGREIGTDLTLPDGESGILRVYANRRLVYQQTMQPNRQIRLPSGFKASAWQFSVTARVPIFSIHVASTGRELASV